MEAKRALVEPEHPEISVRRQCELLGLNRASYYYQPATESALNLELMRRIDEQDGLFCQLALQTALTLGKSEIFNSDQGVQFTALAFTALPEAAGIRISMDGRGRAYDNTFVERLWRSVKYEDIYLYRYATVPALAEGLERYQRQWGYQIRCETVHGTVTTRPPVIATNSPGVRAKTALGWPAAAQIWAKASRSASI